MIVIELPGDPIGKGRPRFGQGRAYTPAKTRAYETALAMAGKVAMRGRPPLDEPLSVRIVAHMPIPDSWSEGKQFKAVNQEIRPTSRPDIDNLIKVMDGLNGIVWRDDAIVVEAFVSKRYSRDPRLTVIVEPLSEKP